MLKNLVLSGGSFKGMCYIGVLRYLESINAINGIENLTGTSIGGLFCLLICIKYSSEELENIILNLDLSKLFDLSINSIASMYSLDTSEKVQKITNIFLLNKGYQPDITFKELFEETGISLTLVATQLRTKETKYFDHIKYPNVKIVDALLASTCIPFIFPARQINDEYYIDGGYSKNLAITMYPDSSETLGCYLKSDFGSPDSIKDIKDYMYSVMQCAFKFIEDNEIAMYKSTHKNIVYIDTIGASSLDVNSTREQRETLINDGYMTVRKFYESQLWQ